MKFNLDDQAERTEFMKKFGDLIPAMGVPKGRAIANRLGLHGPGSTNLGYAIADYVQTAEAASERRKMGAIADALFFEQHMNFLYKKHLAALGWW